MANLIGEHMESSGIKFIRHSVPKRIEKMHDGKLEVTYDNYEWGEEHSDVYDTVVMAIGEKDKIMFLRYQSSRWNCVQ